MIRSGRRTAILRHQHDVADAGADLLRELAEPLGTRQVESCVRLATMTVAAGDHWHSIELGQIDRALILAPVAQAVDLDRVNPAR